MALWLQTICVWVCSCLDWTCPRVNVAEKDDIACFDWCLSTVPGHWVVWSSLYRIPITDKRAYYFLIRAVIMSAYRCIISTENIFSYLQDWQITSVACRWKSVANLAGKLLTWFLLELCLAGEALLYKAVNIWWCLPGSLSRFFVQHFMPSFFLHLVHTQKSHLICCF